MTITNVRKFGETGPFRQIETVDDECACCEAARGVAWTGPGVIFLEVEGGPIRRVENLTIRLSGAFLCNEVTAEEARGELAYETHVCAVCFAPPGVDCNSAAGWCGAIEAGPHTRVPLANPCDACRGTGRYGIGLDVCPSCQGKRVRA